MSDKIQPFVGWLENYPNCTPPKFEVREPCIEEIPIFLTDEYIQLLQEGGRVSIDLGEKIVVLMMGRE